MYARAVLALEQARQLRDRLREDLREHRYAGDDNYNQAYNQLLATDLLCFPEDGFLNRLPVLPDSILLAMSDPSSSTQRALACAATLVNRLEAIFGSSIPLGSRRTPDQGKTAQEVLDAERGTETSDVIEAVERLVKQQAEPPAMDARDFAFVRSTEHRVVLLQDHIEAQRSLSAGSFKPADAVARSDAGTELLKRGVEVSATDGWRRDQLGPGEHAAVD